MYFCNQNSVYNMKKNIFLLALGLAVVLPAKAQWTNWNTSSAISGVFGAINKTKYYY